MFISDILFLAICETKYKPTMEDCKKIRKKKYSMKRQRPWASKTIVAATLLMGLWKGSNGLPEVAFVDDPVTTGYEILREDAPGIEGDATPSPAAAVKPPSPAAMTKESFPVNVDMVLNVTSTVDDPIDLIADIEQVMEQYLLDGLSHDNEIHIRAVTLAVTLLVRRSLLRHLQQTKDITLEVQGSVQYDSTSTEDATAISEELEILLNAENLNQALLNSGVNGVLGVKQATLVDDRDTVEDDSTNTTTTAPTEAPLEDDSDGLERPSTLAIIFGFALTGIAAAGLVAYAYIFYRKRRKRLARQKQMRESIQYHMPNKLSSPSKRPQTPKAPVVTTVKEESENDDGSEESSYKGIDSFESEEVPTDSFARELQMAASLDQQAWENFQQKKEVLDRDHQALKPSSGRGRDRRQRSPEESINHHGGSSQWAKSFPYGDEAQSVVEQGVEWTPDAMDDVSNWEPYNQNDSQASSPKSEEKKEEYGAFDARSRKPFSASTGATLQSIEQTMAMHGSNDDPAVDTNTSDIVSEVERLSRFVQRYDKRKERRLSREQHVRGRSSDGSYSINQTYSNSSSSQTENISYLNNVRPSPREDVSKPSGFGQIGHQAPRITSFTGAIQDSSLAAFNDQILQISDDEKSENTEDRSIISQRLGITPFSVQKPGELSSQSHNAMSPMMQNVPQSTARGADGSFALPMDEESFERRRRTQSDGGGLSLSNLRHNSAMMDHSKPGLHDLRANNAIIDSSKSDVNVGYFDGPYGPDDEQEPPKTPRVLKTSRGINPSPNKRFNKLFNLFEERPNKEGIFPPDPNWQLGANRKSSASTPR